MKCKNRFSNFLTDLSISPVCGKVDGQGHDLQVDLEKVLRSCISAAIICADNFLFVNE
jgi:hypothetical protein